MRTRENAFCIRSLSLHPCAAPLRRTLPKGAVDDEGSFLSLEVLLSAAQNVAVRPATAASRAPAAACAREKRSAPTEKPARK